MPRPLAPPRSLVLPVGLKGRCSPWGDGVDDDIVGSNPLAGLTPCTVVGWFCPSGRGHASDRIAFVVGAAVAQQCITIGTLLSGGVWRWRAENAAQQAIGPIATPGEWCRVVARHSGAANTPWRLNVNGKDPWPSADCTPNFTGAVVKLFRSVANTNPFGGNANDARIYNRCWTDAEVPADYRGEWVSSAGLLRRWTGENPGYGGTCREEIVGTNDPITGALWRPDVPTKRRRIIEHVPASPLGLTGTFKVSIPNHADLNPGTGPFGMMAWTLFSRLANSRAATKNSSDVAPGWDVWLDQVNKWLVCYVRDAAIQNSVNSRKASIDASSWAHWASCRTDTNLLLYVNAGPPATGVSTSVNCDNAAALTLMNDNHGRGGTRGGNDGIWRKGAPFTWEEIESHYYDGVIPTNPGGGVKQVYWGMREGSGTNVASSPAGHAGTLLAESWTDQTRSKGRVPAGDRIVVP